MDLDQISPRGPNSNNHKKKSQQPKLVSTKQKQQQPLEQNKLKDVNTLSSNYNDRFVQSQEVVQKGKSDSQQIYNNTQQSSTPITQAPFIGNQRPEIASLPQKYSQSVVQKQSLLNGNNQQISLNLNSNTFAFDIRQFHPMSPQIQSLAGANNLKEKASELQNATEQKLKKQGNHRRTQSKSQYAVPSSLNLKTQAFKQEDFQLENKEHESKDALIKQIVKQSNKLRQNQEYNDEHITSGMGGPRDEQANNQIESRNIRLRFNSLKTETFDKKSLEKLKPAHHLVAGGNPYNGADSTEDVLSSKQQNSSLNFKLGSDKDSYNYNNNQMLKYTPNSKKDYNEFLTSDTINTKKRLTDFHQHKSPLIDNHQQMQKKVQFDEDEDDEDDNDYISDDNDHMLVDQFMNKRKVQELDSDYGDEEEELKEQVGELPPKIEDLQVVEYEDEDEMYGSGGNVGSNGEDDDCNQDAPTVVIDSSLDDKDYASEFRRMDSEEYKKSIEKEEAMNNIQAALRSIKAQEDEEDQRNKKKKVTIMSVEEEEALVSQINEIRERIKRGETIGQQQQIQKQQKQSDPYQMYYSVESDEQINAGLLQAHFRSVDEANINYQQNTAAFNTKQNDGKQGQQNNQAIQKPPLYSLTFAHPQDAEFNNEKNPLNGTQNLKGFHSIDQNIPQNCIIADDQIIFEKKKQRFERIQKLRGHNTNHNIVNSEQISNYPRSRDDHTPIGGISSSVSNNMTSSQKKSVDSNSNKGSSLAKKSKKLKQNSHKVKSVSNNTLKNGGRSIKGSNIQGMIGPINSLSTQFQNFTSSELNPYNNQQQIPNIDDATSNGSHSTKRIVKGGKQSDTQVHIYSMKKSTNDKAQRQSGQGTIKKKLMHKSKKVPASISQPPTILSENNSHSKGKNISNNLIINVTQEPGMVASNSLKRLKTPKLKLKDDLLQQSNDLLYNPKRLSEFQSISTFKLVGGQSVKNNQSNYKNPFFQTVTIQSNRALANTTSNEKNSMEPKGQEKRVASSSFHKLKDQKNLTQSIKLVNKKEQIGNNVEPSFLAKLIKAKQETDLAFEVIKRKQSAPKFQQTSNPTVNIANGQQDKNSFIDFEKKYKKLSGLINKLFS